MIDWNSVAVAISHATPSRYELAHATPLSGGCINQAWLIESKDHSRYFIKLNSVNRLEMFESERAALAALATTGTLRVPQAVVVGATHEHAFLVLEFIDLSNSGNARLLGEQLAALHRFTSDQFGWQQDNLLGETPQHNNWMPDWIAFWREQRFGYQLALAARNGYGGKLQTMGEQLLRRLPEFFDGYCPQPSLLHGDLWGGNHAYSADGTPVIYDPAPYYGDRETDLAMTELFGGFDRAFYAAYSAAWPLDAGYLVRKNLYNLYHILNHANLFGGSYARQAEGMMQRLLRESD